MKKIFKMVSLLIVLTFVMSFNLGKVGAVADSITVKKTTSLNYHNGLYNKFLVLTSEGVNRYAYCLDSGSLAPSGQLFYIGIGGLDKNNTDSNYYKIMSVLVAAGYPNYTLTDNNGNKLDDDHAFYITQAAVWYARYGGAGRAPLTEEFHNRLKSSNMSQAYNKLLAAINNREQYIGVNDAKVTVYAADKKAVTNEMEQKTINGKDILLSKTEFKIGMYQITSDYTVTVEGGYLTDASGKANYGTSKVFGPNDSFKIAIDASSQGEKTAKFTAKLNKKVTNYELAVYGKNNWQTVNFQTLTMLIPSEKELKIGYTVKGNVLKKHEVFINKVNKDGKSLAGASLEIYNATNDEFVMNVNSVDSSNGVKVNLESGSYYIKEIKAPSGYLLTEEKVNFSIDKDGKVIGADGNVINNKTISIINDLPKIKIRKINERNVDVKDAKIVICSYDMSTKKESNCDFEWITDGTTKELIIGKDFGSINDGSYIIKELEAPHGYEISDPKYITVKDGKLSGDYEKNTVTIIDESYLDVSKTDATGQKEIEGAKIKLLDQKGDLIEEWVSGKEAHRIYGLDTTQIYELVETYAPEGYVPLETSIRFRLNEDGTVNTCNVVIKDGETICEVMSNEEILKIKNDVTKLKISKIDVTNQAELPGATLQILDENGLLVYQNGKILEWVSTDEPHYIEMLPVGKYKLVETISPEGYVAVSNEVLFEVKSTNEIQTVVFENDVTKVMISKKDFTTGEEVPGATLQILNSDGTPVYQNGKILEWVSTNEPHYIEKLPVGKYILVETITPEGYKEGMVIDGVVTTKYEFEVKDNVLVKIDVYNETIKTPNTGLDISSTYIIGSMVMLAGVGTITIAKRKNKEVY